MSRLHTHHKVSAFRFPPSVCGRTARVLPYTVVFYIMRIHVIFATLWYFYLSDQCEFSQLFREFAVTWRILLTFVDYW